MEEFELNENQSEEQPSQEPEELLSEITEANSRATKSFIGSTLHIFMLVFGLVFLSCTLVFQILLTPIQVVGQSMQPTINISVKSNTDEDHCDIVYYNKDKTYQTGDVVIVSNLEKQYINDDDVNYLIKRVIACPGDSITFFLTDVKFEALPFGLYGNVYYYDIIVKDSNGNTKNVDDSFLSEPMCFNRYEFEAYKDYMAFSQIFSKLFDDNLEIEDRKTTIIVEDNKYFVMGDNRNHSEDSRFFGSVKYSDISGEMKLHVPYGKNLWSEVFKKIISIFK